MTPRRFIKLWQDDQYIALPRVDAREAPVFLSGRVRLLVDQLNSFHGVITADSAIVIVSTGIDFFDAEIMRLHGNRWPIECCFKVCKSLLMLGIEYHGVSYDLTVSSTALVFTRYILLEWIRRQKNDGRTLGELDYWVYDEVRDMELADSLRMLFDILLTGIRQSAARIDEAVQGQISSARPANRCSRFVFICAYNSDLRTDNIRPYNKFYASLSIL